MTDLIEVQKNIVPVMVRCDCRTKTVDKKPVKRPVDEQPFVTLYPGIDPRFVAGSCKHCKKQHVVQISGKKLKVKGRKNEKEKI